MWMAIEIALQPHTSCQSVVETVNTVVHQKNGRSAVKKRTIKLGRNHVLGGIAARSAGMRVSKKKKPTTRNTEMISGAITPAFAQPDVAPDVREKLNRIRATVRGRKQRADGSQRDDGIRNQGVICSHW